MAEPNNLSATETIVELTMTAWAGVSTIVAEPAQLLIELRDGDKLPTNKLRAWGRLTIRHNEADSYALGSRYDNWGSLYLNICIPFKATAGHLAQRVALHMTNAFKNYNGDIVEFSRIRSNEIGHTGLYYEVNVLADFQYLQPN